MNEIMFVHWKRLILRTRLTRFSMLSLHRTKFSTLVLLLPLILLISTCLYIKHTRLLQAALATKPSTWTPKYVNISDYKYIRNNETVCKHIDTPLVIAVIHSARSHFDYRKAIRDTWGSIHSYKNWNIRKVFILGSYYPEYDTSTSLTSDSDNDNDKDKGNNNDHRKKAIEVENGIYEESLKYGDIIISDFHDSYRNLTIKHLVGYNWILNYCSNAAYIVKTDDDMLINPFELINYLSTKRKKTEAQTTTTTTQNNQISCHQWIDVPRRRWFWKFWVLQSPLDKWIITNDEYDGDKYPPYCLGAAYITTPALIRTLYNLHDQVRFFWIDDVFVTGMLRNHYNTAAAPSSPPPPTPTANQNTSPLLASVEIDDITNRYDLTSEFYEWESYKIFYLFKRYSNELKSEALKSCWSQIIAYIYSNK